MVRMVTFPDVGSTLYPDYKPDRPSVATAAKKDDLSAIEVLKLLKMQVQDVSRVCLAVACSDLSQKITVPVKGNIMIQLKEVINTMVRLCSQLHMVGSHFSFS